MKNKYTRAFDAIEVDEQKKQETINKVIEYRNKQANTAPNNSTRRTLKSFLFSTKRGVAILTASFMLIVALSVGIPLGINYGGNSNAIIESLTVANNGAYIEYDINEENQMPLSVKVKYKGATERNATSDDVTFRSSNDNIATVDKNGLITIGGIGNASIIVESKKNTVSGDKIQKTVNLPIIDIASISNISNRISLNTKVTLPKIGTNAEPFISVKYDGEDVKIANVDPITGYAIGLTNEIAEFNNDDKMFFYPTMLGVYTIEYYAADDLGNKSIPAVYHIFCSDRTVPLFVGESLQIPSEWGAKVFENGTEISNIINFVRPQFIDNSGEPVTISFAIRDTLNHMVVNFPDINENAFESMYYDGNVEFRQEGFEFDITKYINHSNLPQNGLGLFTIVYTARDTAGNLTKLSFEITFYPEYTKA